MPSSISRVCPSCGVTFFSSAGRANRADRIGAPLYCCIACAGIARRSSKTDEQKRADKAAYDKSRRDTIGDKIRSDKRNAYYANHEYYKAKHKEYRAARMPKHVEYCRSQEYRAKKHDYDISKAKDEYGEWGDTWRLLLDLEKEIRRQSSWYDRAVSKGYFTRNAQKRRRELCQLRKNLNSTPAI